MKTASSIPTFACFSSMSGWRIPFSSDVYPYRACNPFFNAGWRGFFSSNDLSILSKEFDDFGSSFFATASTAFMLWRTLSAYSLWLIESMAFCRCASAPKNPSSRSCFLALRIVSPSVSVAAGQMVTGCSLSTLYASWHSSKVSATSLIKLGGHSG